ncbi:hypothetical protein LXL04_034184 [Taraxacum kok-saghyz]
MVFLFQKHKSFAKAKEAELRKYSVPTSNCFQQAMESRDVIFSKEAMDDEMSSILENNTWVLADLPLGSNPLGCKMDFQKENECEWDY